MWGFQVSLCSYICVSVPDGIVDQGDHVLGNIVVRQAVTEGDGQI